MPTTAACVLLCLASLTNAAAPSPPRLQALVDAAVAARARAFVIPPSESGYFFGENNFTVAGASDFELNGARNTLWFAPGFGMMVVGSTRVRVHNLTLDYYPLAFAQGTLVSLDPANASFIADFDAPEPSGLASYALPDAALYPWFVNGTINTGGNKVIFWQQDGGSRMLPGQSGVCLWYTTWRVSDAEPRRYGVALNNAPFTTDSCFKDGTPFGGATPGKTRVTVSPRDGFALQLVSSSACVVEEVTAYGAGSMAFAEFAGDGGHIWRRMLLTRRPGTARLLSANADGFQSSSCRTGPLLEDSELAFAGDDFVNIHSRIAVVLSVIPPATLIIVDTGGAHIPGVGASRVGDSLGLWMPYTAPIAPLGSVIVSSVAAIDDDAIWASARALPRAMNAAAACTAKPLPCVRDFSPTAVPYNVTLMGGFPHKLPQFALVQALAVQSAGARIANNYFHDGFDKVASMNGGDGALVMNRFERVTSATSVDVGGYFFWMEGALGLTNVTVADNVFVDAGNAATAISVHDARNVTVVNNTFLPADVARV